ncbi:MAG: hypothetical protein R2704_06730 [Microthrixaceae bacterium]
MRNPTVLVLLGLAVVWALVLTPDLVRMYRQTTARRPSGLRSVSRPVGRGTGGAMPALGAPRSGVAPAMNRTQAQQRRALVLFALMVLCVVTFMGGVIMGGTLWVIHASLDILLIGYVYLLAVRAQNQRASQVHRAQRAARRNPVANRPSYLQQQAPAPAAGAVGEVYYLDDARPGNAVAGYLDRSSESAYYDERYADVAYVEDAYDRYDEYPVDEAEGDYFDEWADQPLRRSVGW